MQSQQKNIFNIVIIGGQGGGKTTLFKQIIGGKFTPEYYSTIGIDVGIKEITIEGFNIIYKLNIYEIYQFWDTSGQERFQTISQQYYRKAQCCVIVYDLPYPQEFNTFKNWIKQFSYCFNLDPEQKFPFVIVGTHLDKLTEVKELNLDQSDNIHSFQISLKDDNSIQQIIQAIINVTVLEKHKILKKLRKSQIKSYLPKVYKLNQQRYRKTK